MRFRNSYLKLHVAEMQTKHRLNSSVEDRKILEKTVIIIIIYNNNERYRPSVRNTKGTAQALYNIVRRSRCKDQVDTSRLKCRIPSSQRQLKAQDTLNAFL